MKIIVKPISWTYHEESYKTDIDGRGYTDIYMGGHTRNGETVQLTIKGFTSFAYIECPSRIKWNNKLLRRLVNWIEDAPRTASGDIPYDIKVEQCGLMFRNRYKDDVMTLLIRYTSKYSIANFRYKLQKRIPLGGGIIIYDNELKLHGAYGIDPIIRYTAYYDLPMTDWLEITIDEEGEAIADADISGIVDYKCVKRYKGDPIDVVVKPTYISFDLEVYSKNHNSKLPNMALKENFINQIGIVYGTVYGKVEKKIGLSLGDPWTDQDYKMHKYAIEVKNTDTEETMFKKALRAERELLKKFIAIFKELNPSIIMGYNIMRFDLPGLVTRCNIHGLTHELLGLSRYYDIPGSVKEVVWTSSAYGEQRFSYPELHGRIYVDLLIEVERNYKFSTYRLGYVSQVLLGDTKDDVTPREMFASMLFTMKYLTRIKNSMSSGERAAMISSLVSEIMTARKTKGDILKVRNKVVKWAKVEPENIEKIYRYGSRFMGVVMDYCIQDCMLPIRLFDHLNIWATVVNMSNVMCVPIMYLSTRGQSIRAVAQTVRQYLKKSIFIPSDRPENRPYKGATVIEAHPGRYNNVATLDFASLYPSLIIAFNLCESTDIKKDAEKKLGENMYRKFDVNEHVNCEHDIDAKHGKNDKVICADEVHHFRRVIYDIAKDGTYTEKYKGVLPELLVQLLSERKKEKKNMSVATSKKKEIVELLESVGVTSHSIYGSSKESNESLKKCDIDYQNANAAQLALKVSANSMYGVRGQQKSSLGYTKIASIITSEGRKALMKAWKAVQERFPGIELIYGDSVTGRTPLLLKIGKDVVVKTIGDLFDKTEYTHDNKSYSNPLNTKVWTEQGWTPVTNVMRHKTSKKIYRILTCTGYVEATEDHSLLTNHNIAVTPANTKIGDGLLHSYPVCKGTWFVKDGKEKIFQTQLDAAKYINERLGGKCYSLDYSNKGYTVKSSSREKWPNRIRKIELMSNNEDVYVYDLTTENHHFQAGIGNLIVHNTDSIMIRMDGLSVEEAFEMAEDAAAYATHYINSAIVGVDPIAKMRLKDGTPTEFDVRGIVPTDAIFKDIIYDDQCSIIEYSTCPMDLEFENMYKDFLLLTKKRYAARSSNVKGELIGYTEKGVATKRRNYAKYTQDVYRDITESILDQRSYEDSIEIINNHLRDLYGMRVDTSKFTIFMGITDIASYAKAKKEDKKVVYWIGKGGEIIPYSDKISPLDPRLVYDKSVQACLGLKMIKRGVVLPPNTRLEFIYCRDESDVKQSEKAEDYDYFIENYKDLGLVPDLDYYAESLSGSDGRKQVQEQMRVAYPGKIVYYWGKIEDEFRRVLKEYMDLSEVMYTDKQNKMLQKINACIKCHVKLGYPPQTDKLILTSDIGSMIFSTKIEIYIHSDIETDITLVGGISGKQMATMYAVKFGFKELKTAACKGSSSLYDAACKINSYNILRKYHKYYGIPYRTKREPTQRSINLLPSNMKRCNAVTRKTVQGIKPFELISVIGKTAVLDPKDEETPVDYIAPDTKSDFTYDISHNGKKYTGVLREELLTYYYTRDKDVPLLVSYHQSWQKVKEEILGYKKLTFEC